MDPVGDFMHLVGLKEADNFDEGKYKLIFLTDFVVIQSKIVHH